MIARFLPMMIAARVGVAADAPPKVTLNVPPAFATSVTVTHFRKGQDVLNSPPYRLTTIAAMTEYRGHFGPLGKGVARKRA